MNLGIGPTALILAMIAAFLAAFVRGLTGFGMAILLVPLLGLMILPIEAVTVTNLLGLLIGLAGLRSAWAGADRPSVVTIGLLAMAATPFGLLLLYATPPELARLLIAGVAILAFVLVLLPPHPDGHRPHRAETAATGLVAGVLTGFAGMPGPPVVPYYLRQAISATKARASMLAVFFATSLASSGAALGMGMAGRSTVFLALALFGPVLLGNWLGAKLFGRVPDRIWRWLVALLLGASALAALVRLLQ